MEKLQAGSEHIWGNKPLYRSGVLVVLMPFKRGRSNYLTKAVAEGD